MSCLNNIVNGNHFIVGLRGYDELTELSKPISGLYINDIRGITLRLSAAITNDEYASGLELLKHILTNSARLVIDDFKTQILPDFSLRGIVYTEEFGRFSNHWRQPTKENRGIYISKKGDSKLTRIYIISVEIMLNTDGRFDLVITDGSSEERIQIVTQAGIITTVDVNRLIDNNSVKIVLDTDNTDVIYNMNGLMSRCSSCGYNSFRYLRSTGVSGTGFDNEFYGIKVNANLQCCEDLLICNMLNKMYFLFWLRAGIEFYNELISSKRLNPIAIMNKEGAVETRNELQAEYNQKFKTFKQSMNGYLRGIKDLCIECRGLNFQNIIP